MIYDDMKKWYDKWWSMIIYDDWWSTIIYDDITWDFGKLQPFPTCFISKFSPPPDWNPSSKLNFFWINFAGSFVFKGKKRWSRSHWWLSVELLKEKHYSRARSWLSWARWAKSKVMAGFFLGFMISTWSWTVSFLGTPCLESSLEHLQKLECLPSWSGDFQKNLSLRHDFLKLPFHLLVFFGGGLMVSELFFQSSFPELLPLQTWKWKMDVSPLVVTFQI